MLLKVSSRTARNTEKFCLKKTNSNNRNFPENITITLLSFPGQESKGKTYALPSQQLDCPCWSVIWKALLMWPGKAGDAKSSHSPVFLSHSSALGLHCCPLLGTFDIFKGRIARLHSLGVCCVPSSCFLCPPILHNTLVTLSTLPPSLKLPRTLPHSLCVSTGMKFKLDFLRECRPIPEAT